MGAIVLSRNLKTTLVESKFGSNIFKKSEIAGLFNFVQLAEPE